VSRPTKPNYKGLPICSARGLHEGCFQVLCEHLAPPATCLELGAGSGAFSQRLADAGYTVQAHDLDASRFVAAGIPLWTHDLNQPIPADRRGRTYDLVVAMEVIEHLRDPLGFLQTCCDFCRPGGLVLLSTPNTVDPISYYLYLKRGHHLHHSPTSYRADGHMAVLPFWLLECLFPRVGLEVVVRTSAGCNSRFKARLARWGQSVIQLLLGRKIPKELRRGECLCYLLRPSQV
jgi:SAM-dependent methyltransferase